MKLRFNKADWVMDRDGTWLRLLVPPAQAKEFCGKKKDKDYVADIREWRNPRSLDANAYAWKLLSLLAEALTAEGVPYSQDDMYLLMLKRYGQSGIVKIRNEQAESILREFKYWEEHEKLYDEAAKYYRVWVGSSNYNTLEMSRFIDGIVAECREQGIETATPQELSLLLEGWDAQK